MMPLPGRLGSGEILAWRLDAALHADTWDSGEGAFLRGGRWNSPGTRAVYCALDPATAILEVAVHKGFAALDATPHVLTGVEILRPEDVHVVSPDDLPNPNWLVPGVPSAGQQEFGSKLLAEHTFLAIPSAVSRHSWNLVFVASRAAESYQVTLQERFALDPRLHPVVRN